MKLSGVLETCEWGEKHFGSVATGGELKKRDIDRAIAKGLVKCVGLGAMCDDDGAVMQPERYRNCYRLTAKGRKELAKVKARYAELERAFHAELDAKEQQP